MKATHGATRPAHDTVRDGVRDAYNASGASWADGPSRLYATMATRLVEHSPVDPHGAIALDAGAGTGCLAHALADAGARPIALDLAVGMLRVDRAHRPPAVVADLSALPVSDRAVDLTGAAFSISHVPDPAAALAELARVTRVGGVVLTSTYAGRNDHVAKHAVDAVARRHGLGDAAWYRVLKECTEPLVSQPDALADLARCAGLTDITIDRAAVDLGLDDAHALLAWRLGMPHLAPGLALLAPSTRADLEAEALSAIGSTPDAYRPEVLFLSARVR